MIQLIVVGGLSGLILLVMPRWLMLFGTRWTLKDGDTAEPSQSYVIYLRVVGVLFLVGTALLAWWMYSVESERDRREELAELWDVPMISGDEIELVTDPEVRRYAEFPAELPQSAVILDINRSAIVGDDVLGDLGDVSALGDGDLLVGTGYTACTPIHLIVVEDSERVMVRIVGDVPSSGPTDPVDEWFFCSQRIASEDVPGLMVFRVPLEQPLGDRILE